MQTIHIGQKSWSLGLNSWLYAARRHMESAVRHMNWSRLQNAALVSTELLLRRKVLRGKPLAIKIEPTNLCNFRCPGCLTGAGIYPGGKGMLDMDVYRRTIDQVSSHAFKIVLYLWGEPLIHKQIFEMIEYAARQNLAVQLSSNLNLLHVERGDAERMVRSGLDTLIVSLDGATQETYQIYRVGGKLDKVLQNTAAVVEAKKRLGSRFPRIEMQFIIFPHNRKDLDEVRRIARELNVDRLTIIDTHERAARVKAENRPKKPEPCQALWLFACVNWNGTVVPCCDSVETPFGDLRQESFAGIWNGPAYIKARGLQYGYPYHGPQVEVKCERCRLYNGRPVFEEKPEA